jgi:hypothetical protein
MKKKITTKKTETKKKTTDAKSGISGGNILFVACLIMFYVFYNTYECGRMGFVVNEFYENYKGDFRTIDPHFLSYDLYQLTKQSMAKEKQEVEKVLSSDFPTDKPDTVEGDIFMSLRYDGKTSFKISTWSRNSSAFANFGGISVDFENTYYNKKWTDFIDMRKEHGTWRIHNVTFKENDADKSTKDILRNYLGIKSKWFFGLF